jgi:DNA-binding winged helix-turn-helix (wHTH) protein
MAMRELLVRRAGQEPRRVELATSMKIGRAPDCDIILPSPFVSRHHATIQIDGESAFILEEGSQNGVFINGVRLSRSQVLRKGDEIVIADFELTFWEFDASAPTLHFSQLQTAALSIDSATRQVYLRSRPVDIDLSSQEFDLLALLCNAEGAVCEHKAIGESLWGSHNVGGHLLPNYDRNMVHQLVSRLKQKLMSALGESALIVSVRGKGYRLNSRDR